MKRTYYFQVANFCFGITVPKNMVLEQMLPSFEHFSIGKEEEKQLFCMKVFPLKTALPRVPKDYLVEKDVNDMGLLDLYRVQEMYLLDVRCTQDSACHRMLTTRRFSSAKVWLDMEDPRAGEVLCSMVRFVFSQSILRYHAVSIHASCVVNDGKGYLFLGKSGTGKSTHAGLWIDNLPQTELLNDDNPVLKRLKNGIVLVYGTPWSGKTPCYRNLCVETAGIVRLKQADNNSFSVLHDLDAFTALLPSCMVVRTDNELDKRLYDILEMVVNSNIRIGLLNCLPNEEATRLCYNNLRN